MHIDISEELWGRIVRAAKNGNCIAIKILQLINEDRKPPKLNFPNNRQRKKNPYAVLWGRLTDKNSFLQIERRSK